jgi:hypothetical protein
MTTDGKIVVSIVPLVSRCLVMVILTEVIIAETKTDKITKQFSKVILGEFQSFLAW